VSLTFDDSTYAITPTRFRISRRKFVRYFGRNALHRFVLWLVTLQPDRALRSRDPWFGPMHFWWVHMREQVACGALTPVVVVDPIGGWCAAYTNVSMSMYDRFTPVVKIFKQRLDLADPKPQAKRRYAAASAFCDPTPERPGDWSDFDPWILDLLCDDVAGCSRVRHQLPRIVWDELDRAVAELGPKAREPGLHHLDPARYVAWTPDDEGESPA
jgi:hypothetical protein